ncbi:serine hydrolase [Mesorhizobium sp. LHD-90]|uniref:serine hydrolase domain-containing protein n=1 Tax=Mesorhizobium sp. LHD-90 TaxID=3071414 RepID=UPI0027E085A3|nr:serine hydrolase [Mesorhizobium sp. LHD-90]MDQ6433363.1 serine hydrolase [Mesorhizobium sp. LHD-90]
MSLPVSAFAQKFGFARTDVSLGNWRTRPYSAWSFQNVAEMTPTAEISTSATIEDETLEPLGALLQRTVDVGGGSETLQTFLARSNTDTLVVMKGGVFVGEFCAPAADPSAPHLVFSISKSLTAVLAGALQDEGLLDPSQPVSRYMPEAVGTVYGDATVQQVLDMRVGLGFEEAYLDPESDFARYRRAMLWNPMRPGDRVETLRQVILSLPRGGPHGGPLRYYSPLSDLLGLIVERSSGQRYAGLFREKLWRPLRARGRCNVTVDSEGTARAAGGVSMTARDLARVGEMMRCGGMAGSRAVVSERWVRDTISAGDKAAWEAGDFAHLLRDGSYRNKWYQSGYANGAFLAAGIHGQWLYVDPVSEVVIARLSSQHEPVDDALDQQTLRFFQAVSEFV